MATKKAQQAEPKGYAEAMREVESILSELDSPSVDVDVRDFTGAPETDPFGFVLQVY